MAPVAPAGSWLLAACLLWARPGRCSNVRCWGDNEFGKATPPASLPAVVRGVTTGSSHACAWTAEGAVSCWGSNEDGEATVPPGLGPVAGLSSGANFTCAWTPPPLGHVRCWGKNDKAQTDVPDGLSGVVGVTTGVSHSCAWTEPGQVFCWGGVRTRHTVPSGMPLVASMAAGFAHTCAVTKTGGVFCFNEGEVSSSVPAFESRIIGVSGGRWSACALDELGSLTCWGQDIDGQLAVPRKLPPALGVIGADCYSCAWLASPSRRLAAHGFKVYGKASGEYGSSVQNTGYVECWGCLAAPKISAKVAGIAPGRSSSQEFSCAWLSVEEESTSRAPMASTSIASTSIATTSAASSASAAAASSTSASAASSTTAVEASTSTLPVETLAAHPSAWLQGQANREVQLVGEVVTNGTVNTADVAAFKVPTAGGALSVSLPGSSAAVQLPASAVAGLEGAVFVANTAGIVPDGPKDFEGGFSLVFREAVWPYKPLSVRDLDEPIVISLPANWSEDRECVFWDLELGTWSTEGVRTQPGTVGQPMVCATTHLTFFASIGKGFASSLKCAHLELLSREGLQAMLEGQWYSEPVVICYWLLLLLLLAMMVVAAYLDRLGQGVEQHWRDEAWLIPRDFLGEMWSWRASRSGNSVVSSREQQRALDKQTQQYLAEHFSEQNPSNPSITSPSTSPKARTASKESVLSWNSWTRTISKMAKLPSSKSQSSAAGKAQQRSCARKFCHWCRHSSAVRDAVDDFISRWFHYISEVRDLVESICEGFSNLFHPTEEDRHKPFLRRVAARISRLVLGPLIARSVRKQAAANLGLSAAVVTFLTEDQALHDILLHASSVADEEDPFSVRMKHWLKLHEDVVNAIDQEWRHSGHWHGFPKASHRLFLSSNPFVNAFHGCHFWSRSQRVLFLASELMGAVMVITIFFQVAGDATGKRTRGDCALNKSAGEQLGRLLAVGIASLIVANIPVALLSSLHGRTFKRVPTSGGKEWKRQLLVWRIQDRTLWVLGLLYVGFCAFFVALFLANISTFAMAPWGVTGALTVLQDLIVVPLSIGLLVPLPPIVTLSILSRLEGVEKAELLKTRRSQWEERRGNWFRMVSSV